MSNKRIQICFVVQYLSIGGIETRMLNLLRYIDREIFEPVLICADYAGLQAEKFKSLGIPIIQTRGLLTISRIIQFFCFIRFMLSRRLRRFDVVASFLGTSQPFEIMLGRYGCKNRAFMYALVNKQRQGVEKYWKKRQKYASRIVSISRQTAEYYYANTEVVQKISVIYNGVDMDLFSKQCYRKRREDFGLPTEKVVFCCVARVFPGKGHDVLLDAMKILKRHFPRIHLAIVGQDKCGGWLQRCIVENGLEDSITYLGPILDKIPEFLSVCDAIVLTSESEACGNAILEGMAMELPPVVTMSGADEFVKDGENGYVVQIGDSGAIAKKMIKLAENEGLRKRMGLSSRKWILEHCTMERMLSDYQELFLELARDKGNEDY